MVGIMCFYRIQTKRVTSWQCSVFLPVMSACVFVRVQLMILVDGAGGEWPVIGHAPWNGCNLADFVMPFFLFIVGMAIPLCLKRIPDRGWAVRRVVIRTLKLLFWGILLQGGYSHAPDKLTYGVDMKHVRWGGILQRIALAYLVVAILEIVTKDAKIQDRSSSGFSIFRMYFSQWIVACCILVVYLSLVYGIYVPDWEFRVQNTDSSNYGKVLTVTCGTRGKLNPPCNAVGYIDRKILGINHMYQKPAWRRHWVCVLCQNTLLLLFSVFINYCPGPCRPVLIVPHMRDLLRTMPRHGVLHHSNLKGY